MARVRTRLYKHALVSIVGDVSDHSVRKAATVAAHRARNNIYQLGRVNTGRMAKGIRVRESPTSTPIRRRMQIVSEAPYTRFQEFGTRAHGPVRARFLRFKPKGSNTFVFARWVRGVTPGRFMRRAIDSIRVTDFT